MGQLKSKTVYLCSACGDDHPKWNGQCPSCNEWGTLSEFKVSKKRKENSNGLAKETKKLDEWRNANTNIQKARYYNLSDDQVSQYQNIKERHAEYFFKLLGGKSTQARRMHTDAYAATFFKERIVDEAVDMEEGDEAVDVEKGDEAVDPNIDVCPELSQQHVKEIKEKYNVDRVQGGDPGHGVLYLGRNDDGSYIKFSSAEYDELTGLKKQQQYEKSLRVRDEKYANFLSGLPSMKTTDTSKMVEALKKRVEAMPYCTKVLRGNRRKAFSYYCRRQRVFNELISRVITGSHDSHPKYKFQRSQPHSNYFRKNHEWIEPQLEEKKTLIMLGNYLPGGNSPIKGHSSSKIGYMRRAFQEATKSTPNNPAKLCLNKHPEPCTSICCSCCGSKMKNLHRWNKVKPDDLEKTWYKRISNAKKKTVGETSYVKTKVHGIAQCSNTVNNACPFGGVWRGRDYVGADGNFLVGLQVLLGQKLHRYKPFRKVRGENIIPSNNVQIGNLAHPETSISNSTSLTLLKNYYSYNKLLCQLVHNNRAARQEENQPIPTFEDVIMDNVDEDIIMDSVDEDDEMQDLE